MNAPREAGAPGDVITRGDSGRGAAKSSVPWRPSRRITFVDYSRPACGCGCPATHRPGPAPWGYRDAAQHLSERGLLPAPPDDLEQLRTMWKCEDTRELAAAIATGWAVTDD